MRAIDILLLEFYYSLTDALMMALLEMRFEVPHQAQDQSSLSAKELVEMRFYLRVKDMDNEEDIYLLTSQVCMERKQMLSICPVAFIVRERNGVCLIDSSVEAIP